MFDILYMYIQIFHENVEKRAIKFMNISENKSSNE